MIRLGYQQIAVVHKPMKGYVKQTKEFRLKVTMEDRLLIPPEQEHTKM